MPRYYQTLGRASGSPRVFLAVPSYGAVGTDCVHSLWGAHIALDAAKISVTLEVMGGHCHVDDARNQLVRDFLDTDCDSLIFIDSDVGFRPEDIVRLARHDVDIVAGIYPLKSDPPDFPVQLIEGEQQARADGLLEVKGVPTGFLKISRVVFDELKKKAPRYRGRADTENQGNIPLIFERLFVDNERIGGDYAFCRKARAAGFNVFIDPEMTLRHSGEHTWVGNYANHLRDQNGVMHPSLGLAIRACRSHTADLDTMWTMVREWGNPHSACGDLCLYLAKAASRTDQTIFEAGSGLTSLVMAASCIDAGGEVHSMEQDPDWYVRMCALKRWAGLDNLHIHYAPLRNDGGAGWSYAFPDNIPTDIALAFIDGPPRRFSRKPCYTFLAGKNVGWVVADDLNDPTEEGHLRTWAEANGRTVEILGDPRPFGVAK